MIFKCFFTLTTAPYHWPSPENLAWTLSPALKTGGAGGGLDVCFEPGADAGGVAGKSVLCLKKEMKWEN